MRCAKQDAVYQDGGVIDMVGTFYAVDGSRMRYDSTGQNTGTLYLPDGTRYILGTSTVPMHRSQRQHAELRHQHTAMDRHDRARHRHAVARQSWPRRLRLFVPGFNDSTKVYTLKFRRYRPR